MTYISLSAAFLASSILCPVAMWLSQRGYGLDAPNEPRKQQTHPISRLGGLPIAIACTPLICCSPLAAGAAMIYTTGLLDDLFRLRASVKLLAQIAAGSLAWHSGLSLTTGPLDYPLTVLWLTAIPNSINLVDGVDGLAGGLCFLAAITMGLTLHGDASTLAFGLAGAVGGFLVFNLPPAKLYLGDGGAYLAGFILAALPLLDNPGAPSLWIAISTLIIPIFDTAFAFVRRLASGKSPFAADAGHIHHRLQRNGLSKWRILWNAAAVTTLATLLAVSWHALC